MYSAAEKRGEKEKRGQFGLNQKRGQVLKGTLRVGIGRQQSGSPDVHLEVLTNRATRASPLHRYAPGKTGRACRGRFMAADLFVCVSMLRQICEICGSVFPPCWSGRESVKDVLTPNSMRRPYTDMPPTRPVGRAGGVPWAP